jgi:nitronate monooxygenase
MAGGHDFSPSSTHIPLLDAELLNARKLLGVDSQPDKVLNIGVGFITFHPTIKNLVESVKPILQKHKPAAVWLFAPAAGEPNAHIMIIPALKSLGQGWGLKVFEQVGTVAAAREAVGHGADGIVAQGVDAGGHQWAKGAGIVVLVPEIKEMLAKEFPDRNIAVLAAGGIADGKGAAAALALGEQDRLMSSSTMTNSTIRCRWSCYGN